MRKKKGEEDMDFKKILNDVRNFGEGQIKASPAFRAAQTAARSKPVRAIQAVAEEFSYSPQTLPQDWKYRTRTLQEKYQQNAPGIVQVGFNPSQPGMVRAEDEMWQNASPTKQALLTNMFDDRNVAGQSAQNMPYYFQAAPEDAKSKAIKERILAQGFYPGAQRYLEQVPASFTDNLEDTTGGVFYSQPQGQEHIQINTNQESPRRQRQVMAHELLHSAVDVLGEKELGNFVQDVSRAYRSNPQRYQKVMEWIAGYEEHTQQDKRMQGYFDNPLQKANELFAEVGAQFGPELANDPYLGRYYSKVFNPDTAPQKPVERIYLEDGSSITKDEYNERIRNRPTR